MPKKRKIKKNPDTISDILEDIWEDIETIKDRPVRKEYEDHFKRTVDRIVEMANEKPITIEETKKIKIGLNNLWERIKKTHAFYKKYKVWNLFRV